MKSFLYFLFAIGLLLSLWLAETDTQRRVTVLEQAGGHAQQARQK